MLWVVLGSMLGLVLSPIGHILILLLVGIIIGHTKFSKGKAIVSIIAVLVIYEVISILIYPITTVATIRGTVIVDSIAFFVGYGGYVWQKKHEEKKHKDGK